MASKESVGQFQRALTARQDQFQTALDKTIIAFATYGNDDNRVSAAKSLQRAASDLFDYLAEADRPEWLTQILRSVNRYIGSANGDMAGAFLRTLMDYKSAIRNIAANDTAPVFANFDDLFRRYRDERRLPELFDQLIAALNEIINSGEVDSMVVLSALQRCVDILRSTRNGSYLAVNQGVSVARYVKHLLDVYLEKIPGIKEHREAYARAANEIETSLRGIDEDIHRETLQQIRDQFGITKKIPEYGALEASLPQPKALTYNAPTNDADGVIEGEFSVDGHKTE